MNFIEFAWASADKPDKIYSLKEILATPGKYKSAVGRTPYSINEYIISFGGKCAIFLNSTEGVIEPLDPKGWEKTKFIKENFHIKI